MIVCVCKALSETAVKQLVDNGLTVKQIIATTGACTVCGKCATELRRICKQQ